MADLNKALTDIKSRVGAAGAMRNVIWLCLDSSYCFIRAPPGYDRYDRRAYFADRVCDRLGLDYARQGKLRALATVGAKRAGAARNCRRWPKRACPVMRSMFGTQCSRPPPSRLPCSQLNGEIIKVLYTPDMKARLAAIGLEPAAEPLAATNAYIKSEVAKWMKVVTAAKITAE